MTPPRTAPRAVCFDYGQTLGDLDTGLLAARLAQRGARVDASALDASLGDAWAAYGVAKQSGLAGREAWLTFMRRLLDGAGVEPAPQRPALAAWLWEQQPVSNLWRRPIAGMLELVAALHRSGVPLAIVSNSEGRLQELLAELHQLRWFEVVVDSGLLPFEKPDPRMFRLAAEKLAVAPSDLLHVGDSWDADVAGVLGAGGRAVWFGPQLAERALPVGVYRARDAAELRRVLAELGLTLPAAP